MLLGASVPVPSPLPTPNPDAFAIGESDVGLHTADRTSGRGCSVSMDGFIWYALPAGAVPPIDFAHVRCSAPAVIDGSLVPYMPNWALATTGTKAIFIATSLEETYDLGGMEAISLQAEAAGIPVTWMIKRPEYLTSNASYLNSLHASNGDDVELGDDPTMHRLAAAAFPWFVPAVDAEGAGHERDIAYDVRSGIGGLWGITWDSFGTDYTSDYGAPWGTYCADPSSYKRPSPRGDCSLVAFEWTARDLTRAYLTDTSRGRFSGEAAFSTDPDDILLRGHFDEASAIAYERSLVDAYAAAGVSQPLVMMSQQEPGDEASNGSSDDLVLGALYREAVRDGMKTMTLRSALHAAKSFSAQPRSVAFPFIAGGRPTIYDGEAFSPATIDYHDDVAGMTFLSGHTLPSRVFEYAQDPISYFNQELVATLPTSPSYPQLTGVAVENGTLNLRFSAPAAMRFGVAIWSDPAKLHLGGTNVVPAGHAGAVITFQLPAGESTQTIHCGSCTTTFAYST